MKTIAVLGVGKLGLCFALNAERKGFNVVGVDIDNDYIEAINNKTLYSNEPLVSDYLKSSQNFLASSNIALINDKSISHVFVFVATPSLNDGSYDHSQIERVTDALIQFGKRDKETHLIIGCTTMPGYCNALSEKMKPYNYTVSYNPEFIAQGDIIKNQQNPDQILIGEANEKIGDDLETFYTLFCENNPTICRMDSLSAEIAKIATNCFLTTKISFANSIGDLAIKTGADKEKILNAIGADSRIGNKYLNYGFGFGGPCLPRDNRALSKFAHQNDLPLYISDATDAVNRQHFDFQLQQFLNEYPINSEVPFDGVSYKKGSDLLDESQKLALAVELAKRNRRVTIRENAIIIAELEKKYPKLFTLVLREN